MSASADFAGSWGLITADPSRMMASALLAALTEECPTAAEAAVTDTTELRSAVASARVEHLAAFVAAELRPGDPIAAAAELKAARPGLRVVVTAAEPDHGVLVAALEAGLDGFLSRDRGLPDFTAALKALAKGELCVPRRMLGGLLGTLIEQRRHSGAAVERYATLSRREREVLAMLGQGMDHTAIAQAMVVSPQTARTHIQNVMSKLGVHSRVEAANFATRHGFLAPSV